MSLVPRLLNLSNNETVEITTDRFSVGRSRNSDYILNSAFVSRKQFILEKVDGVWTLQDTSTNGTNVNNTLIKSGQTVKLMNGDLLKFDSVEIVLKFVLPDNLEKTSTNDNPPALTAAGNNSDSGERLCPVEEETTQPYCGKKRSAESCNLTDEITEETAKKKKAASETVDDKNNIASIEEELYCSICTELFVKAVTLNCCHTFCSYCINTWKKKRPVCPICRTRITAMAPTLVLDNCIEKLVNRMGETTRQQRQEFIKQRSDLKAADPNSSSSDLSSIFVSSDDSEEDEDDEYDENDDYEDQNDSSFEDLMSLLWNEIESNEN